MLTERNQNGCGFRCYQSPERTSLEEENVFNGLTKGTSTGWLISIPSLSLCSFFQGSSRSSRLIALVIMIDRRKKHSLKYLSMPRNSEAREV